MKKVTIVIPIYNEEKALPFLESRVLKVIHSMKQYQFEVLLVNDGSKDQSLRIMEQIRSKNSCFSVLNLSRNYGKEIAVMAGLDYAKQTDAVILLDADLQDPPELIPELLKYWEEGYDDVYAQRVSREGETFFKKLTSKIYYRVLQKMTSIPVQKDTGDFRLLDGRCVRAICQMREEGRCSKSIFSWIGYRKKAVPFERQKRIAGQTKWNYGKLINLAIDGIASLSEAPLRWSIYFAGVLGIGGLGYFIFLLLKGSIETSQWIILLILFLGMSQSLFLGILGEYLARIFKNTKKRPLYFVDAWNGKKVENKEKEKIDGDKQETDYSYFDCSYYHSSSR